MARPARRAGRGSSCAWSPASTARPSSTSAPAALSSAADQRGAQHPARARRRGHRRRRHRARRALRTAEEGRPAHRGGLAPWRPRPVDAAVHAAAPASSSCRRTPRRRPIESVRAGVGQLDLAGGAGAARRRRSSRPRADRGSTARCSTPT